MSERLDVLINKVDEFDRAVHGDDRVRALPSGDDLRIITKDGGMQVSDDGTGKKRAIAVVTFTCEGPDHKLYRAQYSVSVRQLKFALQMIAAGYDDDGMPIPGTWGRP